MKKSVEFIILAVSFLLIVSSAIIFFNSKEEDDLPSVDVKSLTSLVSSQLEQCQELTVLKQKYMSLVTVRKTKFSGLAKSYTMVRYQAVLRTGIPDMSKALIEISQDGKKVKVSLPDCDVLGNDITKLEAFDESTSIFITISAREVFDEIEKDREKMLSDAIEAGIIQEARMQAQSIVKAMLGCMQFDEIEIDFIS